MYECECTRTYVCVYVYPPAHTHTHTHTQVNNAVSVLQDQEGSVRACLDDEAAADAAMREKFGPVFVRATSAEANGVHRVRVCECVCVCVCMYICMCV
jgi:hypothetical protein